MNMIRLFTYGFSILYLSSVCGQIEISRSFSKELSQVAYKMDLSCDSLKLLEKEGIINNFDEKELKTGYWIHFKTDSLNKGLNICKRSSEGVYLKGRKEGRWIKYQEDGYSPRLIGSFHKDRPTNDTVYSFTKDSVMNTFIFSVRKGGSMIPSGYTYFYNSGCIDEKIVKDTVYHFADNCDSMSVEGMLLYKYPKKNGINVRSDCSFQNDTNDQKEEPYIKNYLPDKNFSGYIKVYHPDHGQLLFEGDIYEGKLYDAFYYVYDEDNLLIKTKKFLKGQEVFDSRGM